MQDCSDFSADALELMQSCTKPSISIQCSRCYILQLHCRIDPGRHGAPIIQDSVKQCPIKQWTTRKDVRIVLHDNTTLMESTPRQGFRISHSVNDNSVRIMDNAICQMPFGPLLLVLSMHCQVGYLWVSNYIPSTAENVIPNPCPNFKDGFAKPLLKFGYERVIITAWYINVLNINLTTWLIKY